MAASKINIVKGQDKTLIVKVRDSDGDPFSLTGYTAIKFQMEKDDGTTLEKTYAGGAVTVVSEALGKMQVVMSEADTALLKAQKNAVVEVVIDIGSDRKIVQIDDAVNVYEKNFS